MSREVRQKLVWSAIKARKSGMIDQKALDVIQRLVKEPFTPDSDAKIQRFADEFLNKIHIQGVPGQAPSANPSPSNSPSDDILYLRLPSALLELISGYLSLQDALNLANTCFAVNVAVFPPSQWPSKIRNLFVSYGFRGENNHAAQLPEQDQEPNLVVAEPLIQEIEVEDAAMAIQEENPPPPPYFSRVEAKKILSVLEKSENMFQSCSLKDITEEDGRLNRAQVLKFYARGSHMICADDQRNLGYEIMLRYLVPRLASGSLQTKLSCSIFVPGKGKLSSGPSLFLTHASGSRNDSQDHVAMTFLVPYDVVPPVISAGGALDLHALENDGRTISRVRTWRCGAQSQRAFVSLVIDREEGGDPQEQTQTLPGTAGVTLVGERACRYLGNLLRGEELAFATELTSSAEGGHGLGSFDVRNVRESVTYQTPRTVFKAPQGYFEVSRNGVEIHVPILSLFTHVV